MITLKVEHLAKTNLVGTLASLLQVKAFNGKIAFRLGKIFNGVAAQQKQVFEEFQKLGQMYGKKAEGGQALLDPTGFHFPLEGQEEIYKEKLAEFLGREFSIPQHKIPMSCLPETMSPNEMIALEPILEDLDEESAAVLTPG